MALLTTLEGEDAAPLTINDLFNVNDYYGVKLFGDSWNQVKRAAAIIAQRAANAPIMFYLRSQKNDNNTGMFSQLGRDLWGYNDRAGVALLGRATWNAVKGEFDELLGAFNWKNPFSYFNKVVDVVSTPIKWVGRQLRDTNLPAVKQIGQGIVFFTTMGKEFTPITTAERITNLIENKGYVTQAEIDEAYEIEKAAQRQKALEDSAARASKAASEAAKAQAEWEKAALQAQTKQKEYEQRLDVLEQTAQSTGLSTAAKAAETSANNFKTALVVGGVGLGVYLLTRKRGK